MRRLPEGGGALQPKGVDVMTQSERNLARTSHAVFASDLPTYSRPDRMQLVAALQYALEAHGGYPGCLGRVAEAYGDHPETAQPRMSWARELARTRRVPLGIRLHVPSTRSGKRHRRSALLVGVGALLAGVLSACQHGQPVPLDTYAPTGATNTSAPAPLDSPAVLQQAPPQAADSVPPPATDCLDQADLCGLLPSIADPAPSYTSNGEQGGNDESTTVRGTVIDQNDAPMPGIVIELRAFPSNAVVTTRTGPDGTYAIDPGPGTYQVFAVPDNLNIDLEPTGGIGSNSISVPPGAVSNWIQRPLDAVAN